MLRLSRSKYKALSEISIAFSAIFFASFVLPIIIEFDKIPFFIVGFGVIGTIIFVFFALEFAEKGKL